MLSESYVNRIRELGGILLNELSSEEIYQKYYATKVNPGNFLQIVSSDPTSIVDGDNIKKMGNYSKWLLNLFLKHKLKTEDLYKVTEYLTFLEKNKSALKSKEISLDINKYADLPSLFKVIQPFMGKSLTPPAENVEDENELLTNGCFIENSEAKKIDLGTDWVVFIPKTLRASQFYGCSSEWCTTKPREFEYYSARGDLYIFVDKNKINSNSSERRIQVHLEEGQYMDMYDSEIDKKEFLDTNPEILNFLFNIEKRKIKPSSNYIIKNGKYYYTVNGWEDFAEEFKENRDISDEFIKKVLSGNAWEMFESESNHYDINNIIGSVNDSNLLDIKKLIIIDYPKLRRKKFDIQDVLNDYEYDLDEIKSALKQSMAQAQESADESEAYNSLLKVIKNRYDIISHKWAKNKKGEHKLLIQIPESTFKMLLMGVFSGEDDKIDYNPPYNGYYGNVDDAYFNENLSDKLSDLFPEKEKKPMAQAAESVLRDLIKNILEEDYRFEYKQNHTPTDSMSNAAKKAQHAVSQNNLIAQYKSGGGVVTGEKRAAKIINKEPLNHDEVRAIRDLFVSMQDELNQAKNQGKNVSNSAVIQIWELNGGDAAKGWANNILGTHHTKSLKHKDLRRGYGDVGIVKNMMKARLPKKQNPK